MVKKVVCKYGKVDETNKPFQQVMRDVLIYQLQLG